MSDPGHFVVYETATGRIVKYGVCAAADIELQAGPGEAVLAVAAGVRDSTHYVAAGEIAARPAIAFDKMVIAADGIDTATLAGLPDPCTVVIDGDEQVVTGGTLEFSAAAPGAYRIQVLDPFPAREVDAEIVAA